MLLVASDETTPNVHLIVVYHVLWFWRFSAFARDAIVLRLLIPVENVLLVFINCIS